MTNPTPTSGAADLPEALYADAVKFAKERASISYVQRKCRCSYNKAERMLEQMVADGIIQTYNWRKDAALTAQAISAESAAHVQNPAEIEHVAGDVSKAGAESNTSPQAAPAEAAPLTCEWTHNDDDGFWETACGEAWRFDDGGPAENSMHFCHSCGKSLCIKGGQHGAT